LLNDWKAASYFGFDEYWNHHAPGRRSTWLRRMATIEEVNNQIQGELMGSTVTPDDPEQPQIGSNPTRVYDKDKGGFIGKPGAGGQKDMTPVEEFAGFASQPNRTMTTKDLRAIAARLAKQGGGS
jgi:hypothetical protein